MKKLLRISSAVCVSLLAVLGFNSCNESTPEYGVPPSIYGQVTDKITGKPIKGIKVTNGYFGITPAYGTPNVEYSAITDGTGNYFIETNGDTMQQLRFSDIDGSENGLYRDTVIDLNSQNHVRVNMALTPEN